MLLIGRELLAPATWTNNAPHGIAADINSSRSCRPCQTRKGALRNSNKKSCKRPWPQLTRRARCPSTSGWLHRAPPRISVQGPSQKPPSGRQDLLEIGTCRKDEAGNRSQADFKLQAQKRPVEWCWRTRRSASCFRRAGRKLRCSGHTSHAQLLCGKTSFSIGEVQCSASGSSSPEGNGKGNRNSAAVGEPTLACIFLVIYQTCMLPSIRKQMRSDHEGDGLGMRMRM